MIKGTATRITANFTSLLSSQIISRFLQLVVFIYLARALGKGDFGVLSFALAFGLLIGIITDFGLSTLLVREISRNKKSASKYLSNALMTKILLSIISISLSFLVLNIMQYSEEIKTIAYIIMGFALLQTFTELYFSIFRAFEQMKYEAFIKILRMLIISAAIFYLLTNGYGLLAASIVFFTIEVIMLIIVSLIIQLRFTKINFSFDYEFSKKMLKNSSWFFLSMIFVTLYLYIDQIMLSKIRGPDEVGIYSAAANLIIALIFIPQMYAFSVYPVLSKFHLTSKKSYTFLYKKSFKYFLILGLAAAAGIFIFSEPVILLLYGEEYKDSAIVLSILSGYLFLKFLNPIIGHALMSANREKARFFSQMSAALINIVLNFILIPLHGFVGAAFATLITEIIFFGIYSHIFKGWLFHIRFLQSFVYKPIIAVIIMVFALSFIGRYLEGAIGMVISISLGAIIYFMVLYSIGAMDKEDKTLLMKIKNNH